MTPKDRLALSAYMEMLDDTVDLRNDSISMNGGEPVRLLLADRDEIEADRDRLRSELDAKCAELARVRRSQLRRMEIGVFRVWNNLPPKRQTRKNALRLQVFQCACRAELARMGEP